MVYRALSFGNTLSYMFKSISFFDISSTFHTQIYGKKLQYFDREAKARQQLYFHLLVMKHKWLWRPEVFPTENEIKKKSNKTKFSPFFKSSRSQALYKKVILKNLAKSTGNWCCLSLFFDNVTGLEPLFEHLFYWTPRVTAFVFWKMISCRISMFHTYFEYKHLSFI